MITAKSGSSTTTYTYDYHNRLTEVTQGGTVIATYAYDAVNRRIGVDDNGTQTWTVYDGTNPYADFNGSGYAGKSGISTAQAWSMAPWWTSSWRAQARAERPRGILPDKLGSVRDIVSTSGTVLDHVVYDSFGNIVTETNASNGDRFKYAGMQFDAAIGQYYDDARWYSPSNGTFISLDPMGFSAGTVNLFGYTGDDPTNATDPTGDSSSSGYQPQGEMIAGVTASISYSSVQTGSFLGSSSSGDALDWWANFFAGWGDTLTFGGTSQYREYYGINDGIDTSSKSYGAGQVTGGIHQLLIGGSSVVRRTARRLR